MRATLLICRLPNLRMWWTSLTTSEQPAPRNPQKPSVGMSCKELRATLLHSPNRGCDCCAELGLCHCQLAGHVHGA